MLAGARDSASQDVKRFFEPIRRVAVCRTPPIFAGLVLVLLFLGRRLLSIRGRNDHQERTENQVDQTKMPLTRDKLAWPGEDGIIAGG